MNIPLNRLIEGIIATMRSDVIPNISDSYARGQAVGVIDLLNNIAPRIEWAQAPLEAAIAAKIDLLAELEALAPAVAVAPAVTRKTGSGDDLVAARARLDAAIGDAIGQLWSRRSEPGFDRAVAAVKAHLHEELATEMKITRKPLFAEIASGADGNKG